MSDSDSIREEIDSGPTVFISYRRGDTGELAETLAVLLREDLGGRNVFRDKDDIIVGERWQDALRNSMQGSDAAVFLVGPQWSGPREDGTRRIDDNNDPVRNEVIQALGSPEALTPLPFLVDCDDPPTELPADVESLFHDYQYVGIDRTSFETPSSSDYQSVLVGVWNSLRMHVPNGVLILGERTAMAELDALVEELRASGHIEARHLSRFASGAYIASRREFGKAQKEWPEVIVNVPYDDPSEEHRGRIAAISALPGVRNASLIGAGAVAGIAIVEALGVSAGSSVAFTQGSIAQLVGGLAQPAAASTGSVSSLWASLGIGAKVAAVAAASAITIGGAVGVVRVLEGDQAQFSETSELLPQEVSGDAYPLGEPGPITVSFGSPHEVSEEESLAYFGNYPGGIAERRSVEIEYSTNRVDLGDIVIPLAYPAEYLQMNVGEFRITSVASEGEVQLIEPGTGAASPCVYDGTGDTVGGWEYTGGPGLVSLELLFESDGASVTGVGMIVTFDGPADIILFEDVVEAVIPDDVDVTDRCTPVERLAGTWTHGTAQSE